MRDQVVAGAALLLALLANSGNSQTPYGSVPVTPPHWSTASAGSGYSSASGGSVTAWPAPAPSGYAPPMQMSGPPPVLPEYSAPGCASCGTPLDYVGARDPDDRVWFIGEYLFWQLTGAQLPPLLTVSQAGTPQQLAGILGTPGTQIIAGGQRVNDDFRSGLRVRAGVWLDDNQRLGLELGYLLLEGQGDGGQVLSPDGSLIVGRPYFDAVTGLPSAELVAFPGVLAGLASVRASSSNFYGGNAFLTYTLAGGTLSFNNPCNRSLFRVNLVGGFTHFRFDDSVRIQEELIPLGAAVTPGSRILIADHFTARNRFYGGTVGMDTEILSGRFSLQTRVLASLGQAERKITISGQTLNLNPVIGTAVNTGGLLALVSNIGTYESETLTVIPQVDVWVGYRATENLRLLVGYSFLYWPNVVRAGEQIDPVVNRNLLPPISANPAGPSLPKFTLKDGDLFLHGFTAGLELSF